MVAFALSAGAATVGEEAGIFWGESVAVGAMGLFGVKRTGAWVLLAGAEAF